LSIRKFTDLDVYNLAEEVVMEIFYMTSKFPGKEKYSLTDQIRRSSGSVAVKIADGWGKRTYENQFKRHLIDSMGSLEETKSWLSFALKCDYLENNVYPDLFLKLEEIGAKLFRLHQN
jgi:four helix bundle protein